MSRHEDVDNAIWSDPDFEELSAYASLLYLWSFTNPRCGMAGLYRVSKSAMTESKVPAAKIDAVLDELAEAGFLFYENKVLWVRSRVKHIRAHTTQIARSIQKDVEKIAADHPLRARFVSLYASEDWLTGALAAYASVTTLTPEPAESPIDTEPHLTIARPSNETSIDVSAAGSGSGLKKNSNGPSRAPARGDAANDEIPSDFPADSLPQLRSAFRILRDLAERHGAKPPSPLSLAQVVMGRRYRPIVKAALDCAAHWDAKPARHRVKDVVAAYRNWLENTDDLPDLEQLDDHGLPVGMPSRNGRNGHGQAEVPSPDFVNAWNRGNGDTA